MLHSSPAPLVGPGCGTPWAPPATAFDAHLAPRHTGTLSRRWRRGLWRGRADLPAPPGLSAVRGIPCRRTARGAGGFHGGTAARGWVVADSVQLVDGGELSSAVRCGHACSHIEKIVRLTRLPGGCDALPRSAVILPTAASRRPHRRVLLHFQSLRLWAHAQTPLLDPRSGPPRPRPSRRTPHPPRRPAPPRSGGQARGTRIRARPCSWSCRRCCSWRPRGRPSAYYPSTCSLYIRRIVRLQVCLICILLILNRQSLLATHEQIIILLQIQGPSSDLLGSLLTHERPAWQGQQLCRKGSGSSSPNAIAPFMQFHLMPKEPQQVSNNIRAAVSCILHFMFSLFAAVLLCLSDATQQDQHAAVLLQLHPLLATSASSMYDLRHVFHGLLVQSVLRPWRMQAMCLMVCLCNTDQLTMLRFS